MSKLKEGTPVWYNLLRKPRIGIIKDVLLNTYALIGEEGRYTNVGVKPLTVSEYINEVMVPDGWIPEYNSAYLKLFKMGDQIKCLVIKAARNPFWEPTQYCPNIDEFAIIKDSDVTLQQQTLTHCERLNLLKELEA